MTKLATRGIATAEAIRDRKPFTSHGALQAGDIKWHGSGRLNEEETATFHRDYDKIVYAVYSYATPIAWVLSDGTTYKVAQRFSVTTSKHQGVLYLLDGE